jgi:hypothetical protein
VRRGKCQAETPGKEGGDDFTREAAKEVDFQQEFWDEVNLYHDIEGRVVFFREERDKPDELMVSVHLKSPEGVIKRIFLSGSSGREFCSAPCRRLIRELALRPVNYGCG